MKIHVDKLRDVWLSYGYLKEYGIPENTIENWSKRNIGIRKHIDGHAFINYDTIPEETRNHLLPKSVLRYDERQERREALQKYFFRELEKAYTGIQVTKWRNEIKKDYEQLSNERTNDYARRAAVLERILSIYHGRKGELSPLHRAYLQLFPDDYTMKNRFCMLLKEAKQNGVLSAAIDKRATVEKKERFNEVVKYFAAYILNHNKAYSIKMAHEIFREFCEKEGYKAPAITWFQNFYIENRNVIDANRYGKADFEKHNQNYAKIIPALYSGDQWQMDGWRIPVYCKKWNENGNIERFVTYNLFVVLDARSRKIIGHDIAESENTETILKGLETAIKNTSTLPYEIVSDNHSFNKTKEAGSLKDEFSDLGVTWTVDSNPRRKAILERAFGTLGNKHFKKRYGYIGQGVKSKVKNGITQPELMDKYTKTDNLLTYEQVVSLTISVIDEYNNTVISKLKDTPNSLYEKSEKPHAIAVDDFLRMSLFVRKTEHKVRHGQITIQRGEHKYEYQLPAQYSVKYNNKTIGVRYADFEEIYLYDLDTDKPVCSVHQKHAIHGALANQTEKDREYLLKNKGRMKGIETQIRKKKEVWASSVSMDVHERIGKKTNSKDVIEEIKNNSVIQLEVINQFGFNPEDVPAFPVIDENLDTAFKPRKKENKHPFSVKGNNMSEKLIIDL
jgi:hypothetical protein